MDKTSLESKIGQLLGKTQISIADIKKSIRDLGFTSPNEVQRFTYLLQLKVGNQKEGLTSNKKELEFISRVNRYSNYLARKGEQTDPLTGLKNRRYLEGDVTQQLRLVLSKGNYFSFIIYDLDNFKQSNDFYGHQFGDQVLKDVSSVTRNSIKDFDTLFRYGGDEFCIILPQTNRKQAIAVASRLQDKLKEASYPKGGQDEYTVNISAGVIEVNENEGILLLYGEKGRKLISDYISAKQKGKLNKEEDKLVKCYLKNYDNGRAEIRSNQKQKPEEDKFKKKLIETIDLIEAYMGRDTSINSQLKSNNLNYESFINKHYEKIAAYAVIEKADMLLNLCKKNGRNMVLG